MKCNQPGSMSIVLTLISSPLIGPLTTNHRLTVIFEHDQALTFVIVRKNSLYFHPLPYRLFLHTIRAILSPRKRLQNWELLLQTGEVLLGSKFGHITMQSNHVVRMSVLVYGDTCA